MNELYLIKSGDNGFVEETSAVISADSGEISINDSLYVESAGNIGIGSSNPVNKLDVVGSASISNNLTVEGITFSNVGGQAPNEANDIIMYDGSDWVIVAASQLPGGGGGAGNSAVPAGLINALTEGDAIHEVTFGYDASGVRIAYDNVPKIAASLEIDGAGEIIPHTISGVSESGYFVVFSEELPTANYRMHTVFGGTDAFWETGVANLEYSDRNVEIDRSLYVGQKVGIGTTNPGSELEVNGTIKFGDGHTIGDGPGQNLHVTSSAGENILYTAAGGIHAFLGGSDERLRIDAAGNVGIGVTNPGAKLEVDYVAAAQVGLTLNGSNTALNNAIKLTDASNNAITLSINAGKFGINGGNVGIGTTNPTADLHINSDTTITTSDSQVANLRFQNGSNINDSIVIAGRTDVSGATNYTDRVGLAMFTKGSERMRIDSSGKVGIGTANPIGKLSVMGDNADIFLQQSDGTISAQIVSDSSGNGKVTVNNSVGNPICHLDSNGASYINGGNVGVGATNPSSRLQVEEPVSTNQTTALFVRNQSTHTANGGATIAGFHNASDYVMQIKTSGNVGIGTTNPTNALNVIKSSNSGVPVAWLHNSNNTTSGNQGVTVSCINNNSSVKVFTIRSNNSTHTNGTALMEVNGQGAVYLSSLAASSDVVTNSSKQLTTSSDKRLKNDLGDCEYGLSEIMQVQPKKYTWKEGPEDQQPTIGFFAQDVHPIMPEAAPREAFKNEKDEDDYKWGLNSQTIIAALVNATKEQQTMIEDLKKEIEQLKS
jgi:hypothetical protein